MGISLLTLIAHEPILLLIVDMAIGFNASWTQYRRDPFRQDGRRYQFPLLVYLACNKYRLPFAYRAQCVSANASRINAWSQFSYAIA